MNTPPADHTSSRDARAISSNPIWLLVGAGALFFAFAAALLASA